MNRLQASAARYGLSGYHGRLASILRQKNSLYHRYILRFLSWRFILILKKPTTGKPANLILEVDWDIDWRK